MNNTLDRLKALSSKLDEKLAQKTQGGEKKISKNMKEGGAPKKETKATSKKSDTETEKVDSVTIETAVRTLIFELNIDEYREKERVENLRRLSELFFTLEISKKIDPISDLFIFKAMNISGIGLKEEDFGEVREGKYVQVIAITYEPDKNGKKKAKNISLGYFGKAEALDEERKNKVIEFVLRWRYEKAFQNLEHYRSLLERVRPKETLF